jgi:UDP-glucose 4-epimerase
MRILIIGSKGFIGVHAEQYFKNKVGYEVWSCDVLVDYGKNNYFVIDATNADYHSVFQSNIFDICINCSGAASVPDSIKNPIRDYTLNTYNVFKILDAIRQYQPLCRFMNLSSAAVYGNPKKLPIKESDELCPVSPYGIHKVQAEQICREFYTIFGIKTCSLRIFSAYGEGLKKQLFWDIYQKCLLSKNVELFGSGEETRDFIYIQDLLQVLQCIIDRGIFNGEAVNVSSGFETTIKQAAHLFCTAVDNTIKITFNNIVKFGDPLNWKADISVIKSYGFEPQFTIEEGLKKTSIWMKENA